MSRNPFPGPQPYRATARKQFFGRDELAVKLLEQILAWPATALFGPSGAGKSSLMSAAVVPQLEETLKMRVVSIDAWPAEKDPLPLLVSTMYHQLRLDTPSKTGRDALEEAIERAARRSERPLLVYLDQLEQIFNAEHPPQAMQDLLWGLAWLTSRERPFRLHLVLSLREDYFGRLRDFTRDRPELTGHGFRVAPLSVGEMAKAMCKTAEVGEPPQIWDPKEIHQLMLDVRVVGQPARDDAEVQSAFGQIVCRALWEERDAGDKRGVKDANAEAILHRYLETTLKAMGGLEQAARTILEEHLIDNAGHRTLLTEAEALLALNNNKKDASDILGGLEKAAVLRAEEHEGSRYFELGHDWLAKKVFELREAARKEATERKREQEQAARLDKERSARRKMTAIAAVSALVAVAMGSLGYWALVQRRAAIDAQVVATKLLVVAQTAARMSSARERLTNSDSVAATLVLVEVAFPEKTTGFQQLALDALAQSPPRLTLRHPDEVTSAVWSPDGKQILTASDDGQVRRWSADGTGSPNVLAGGCDGQLTSAVLSPDGRRLLVTSLDNLVCMANADGSGAKVLVASGQPIYAAAFSPDGERILLASEDGTAQMWNASNLDEPPVIFSHPKAVKGAAFDHAGKRIVTACADGFVRIWSAEKTSVPVLLEVLGGHLADVYTVAFSPDDTALVSASKDFTGRVWSVPEGGAPKLRAVLRGHAGEVNFSAWSPDGQRIVTASNDKTVRVWDRDGNELATLFGHTLRVWRAEWSPDGKRILSASKDGTARVWDLSLPSAPKPDATWERGLRKWPSPSGRSTLTTDARNSVIVATDGSREPRTLGRHDAAMMTVAWYDEDRFVTTSEDNTAAVWSLSAAQNPTAILRGHDEPVVFAKWSHDGTRLVTTSWDDTAAVWKADGTLLRVLRGHDSDVHVAAWSSDDERIATGSYDKTVRIWSVSGPVEPLLVLKGHPHPIYSLTWGAQDKNIVAQGPTGLCRFFRLDVDAQALRDATTTCLTPWEREEYLAEAKSAAAEMYEKCERDHGREPVSEREDAR